MTPSPISAQQTPSPQAAAQVPAQGAQQGAASVPADQQLRMALIRVVIAGKKIMYSDQTRGLLKQALLSGAPPDIILATQVAGLLKMMDDRSGMNIPKPILVPAGLLLLQDLIKFVEQAKLFKISAADAKQAVQKMIVLIMREYALYDQQVAKSKQQQAQRLQQIGAAQVQQLQAKQQAQQQTQGAPQAAPAQAAPAGIISQAQGVQ